MQVHASLSRVGGRSLGYSKGFGSIVYATAHQFDIIKPPEIDALTSSRSLPAGYAAADHTIAAALCPGGKERMGRLLAVAPGSINLKPLVTHGLKLNEIERVLRQSG